ncbi:S1 family peptidase [Pseudomonas gingeri]|uniref:Trypsin-like peptidase domain-containing protein n=1 Tax=Pseudomonas gingeri TaxID=117681 RepID=A0A7Y7YC82_9PSED|nr:serine protease [Pseudomonas gingeri]NWB25555.1 trypsin-like peptidase domain-containing protein [Pseudomonas gingeri]NWC33269.1 trypsin-like peptidase domain-containing protein [Pseudomonas gingeri]NWE25887.1 trypsin-like peptidase domain-containing protein [Pseudomonas gingeri]NWE96257.1 trypsin-like peptidase domain-containing protein [Pseudomonas gingeri]
MPFINPSITFKTILLCYFSFSQTSLAAPIARTQFLGSIAAIFSENKLYTGLVEKTAGTGFIISGNGDILTAMHVAGDPSLYETTKIKVYLPIILDGQWKFKGPFFGSITSTLPKYDLATIHLDDISLASTAPIMAFNFIKSMSFNDEFKGLGYNILTEPPKSTASQISANYAGGISIPPFQVIEEYSLNAGSSGGPLFQDDRVTAIWHGRVENYTGIDGKNFSLKGTSLAIPMTTTVQDWLKQKGITPMVTRPEYPDITFKQGFSELEFDDKALRSSNPNSPSAKTFLGAPLGTDIVAAYLVTSVKKDHCVTLPNTQRLCSKVIAKERTALEVDSGRLVYAPKKLANSERVVVTLRESKRAPDILVENVEFNSLMPQNSEHFYAKLSAGEGKSVLAATVNIDGNTADIDAKIRKGAVVVSSPPEKTTGFFNLMQTGERTSTPVEPQRIRGSAVLLIGETGATVTESEISKLLNSNQVSQPVPTDSGSTEGKIIYSGQVK